MFPGVSLSSFLVTKVSVCTLSDCKAYVSEKCRYSRVRLRQSSSSHVHPEKALSKRGLSPREFNVSDQGGFSDVFAASF